ncbi:adhesion G-protein coupled receptor G6-like [Dreissena polymorpha]|nr:adhesion G-protein coupled receptor G6-like [Dreissena polymorpha]
MEKRSKYFTKVSSNPSKTSAVFGYISLICLSISILSLIATLIVYIILPNLRTLPGLNIMSLSTWLLISSSLLFANNFVTVDVEWLCKTLGFLLHFSLLSGFGWMFICTFHIMRTFTSLTNHSKNAPIPYSTYVRYVAVAEILAIVLSASHVIVSMKTNNTFGYGGHPCYLTNPRMNLFFVAIPISVVMVTNLVMFISVIVKLMRLPQLNGTKSRERNNITIFIKLSTITGMAWIFGIVYELTDVELFGFLFIIFNASQGVLIMFSFVINKRVASLLFKNTFAAPKSLSTNQTKTRPTKEMAQASQHVT